MSHSKLKAIFNKIHASFVDELNKATSNEFIHVDSYSTIQKTLDIKKLVDENPLDLDLVDFSDLEILDDIKASCFIDKISSIKSVKIFFLYLEILGVIIEYIETSESDENDDAFIVALQQSRKGEDCVFETENPNIEILFENISKLSTIKEAKEAEGEAEGEEKPSINMSYIENSKIGQLAKEISEEIDFSSISSLDDVSKFIDPKNNLIGDIVSKVGSKIHNKLNNGELNQEDLLSEAFGMINSFGGKIPGIPGKMNNMSDIFNNPMMKNILESIGGGGGGGGKGKPSFNNGKMRQMSARERLKTKLKEKSKQ